MLHQNKSQFQKNAFDFRSLPWNQTTLLGYFGESTFMMFSGETFVYANGIMMLIFISICIHHLAFYEMLKYSIEKWNRLKKNQNDERFICNQIHFHNTVKEWVFYQYF